MFAPQPMVPLKARAAEIEATIGDPIQLALFRRILDRVDPKAHLALQDKYRQAAAASEPGYIYKYLDLAFWIRDKIVKAFAMDLASGTTSQVLDLGTGAGHFLAVCDALGIEGVGIDVDVPFYIDMCALMEVDRRSCRIEPSKALPNLGRFDLVTAFQIKFDALGVDGQGRYLYWSLREWDFFVRDVTRNLVRYPGVLRLELNSRVLVDGTREKFMDVLDAFRSAGAMVEDAGSFATFQVERPISLTTADPTSEGQARRIVF